MLTKVQKWGNSLALRIPKAFADETGLTPDSAVEITVVDGQIRIVPVHEEAYDLEALLDGITDENRHEEVDTGAARGSEFVS